MCVAATLPEINSHKETNCIYTILLWWASTSSNPAKCSILHGDLHVFK
jgi:hypothetical protein